LLPLFCCSACTSSVYDAVKKYNYTARQHFARSPGIGCSRQLSTTPAIAQTARRKVLVLQASVRQGEQLVIAVAPAETKPEAPLVGLGRMCRCASAMCAGALTLAVI
jgi:hypothetical protein